MISTPEGTPPQACFIFDLDGTLLDFMAVYRELTTRVLNQFGLELLEERFTQLEEMARSQVKGRSSPWIIVKLLWRLAKKLGLSFRKRFSFLKACNRHYKATISGIVFLPGAVDAVAALRERGFRIALLTSAASDEIQDRLSQHPDFLEKYVDLALGRDNVKFLKPDPDGILTAASHFDVPPSCCCMVGDMNVDILAGKAAGAVAVGVLTGFDDRERLTSNGADIVLNSVAELPDRVPDVLKLMKPTQN